MDNVDNLNAAMLGQLAIKAGLLTQEQVEDAIAETGMRNPDPDTFLRALERRGLLTPWQSGKLLKAEIDGYFLGGYKIEYKIQSGSFGRVYRAADPRTGRVVAIKVLRRRWSEDPMRIGLFHREGKVGLTLKHPGIVEVLAVNQDPNTKQYYIVMEFVEGGNLRELLQIRHRMSPAEALRIIEDLASGLAYAFSRGLTHRDVKLTNILISSTGTAKLVDFGLAQIFAGAERNSEKEKIERTVDYAGLERATNVKTGDVRSDIYFLGCVLYEMLIGRSPLVTTRDRHQRMQKQRFDNAMTMTQLEVNAPPAVFGLVETMMSLDAQRRFQTPSQLLDAVRAARREVEGKAATSANGAPTNNSAKAVFVAEADERLQDVFRVKLKELGYRVLLAGDPVLALNRFRQQPYDALVVDAETTGEEGLLVLERVLAESRRKNLACVGVLLLGEEQADWASRAPAGPQSAVLVKPGVGIKQVHKTLQRLLQEKEPATQ
jgi:eukaryotic-like serine/threonine-protein kinase